MRVAVLAASILAAGATPASAVIMHLANGKVLSYQPAIGEARVRPLDALFSNLDYNGGPVMASNTNYAIYWAPSGSPAYPSDYQAGVNQYLNDLSHDSGGHENVESIATQYNDAMGHFALYNSHFGGALVDKGPYPPNGCEQATKCLTDEQLRAELIRYLKAQGLPRDLNHEYFLLTPPGVEDCAEASGAECSAGSKVKTYCAYHGSVTTSEGVIIYSNDPYVTGNAGCDKGNHPNGSSSDGVLSGGLSHEHIESLTDPEPNNAWTDFGGAGGEIGDKCHSNNAALEFGQPLGKASNGASYNQVINGHLYWYQQEWSNQGAQCLQRLTFTGAEPTGTFTNKPEAGNKVTFNATGSTAPGGVSRYNWQFNDGPGPAAPIETSSPTISHVFPTGAPYLVALTVFASDGTSIGAARTIRVPPTAVTGSASTITPSSGVLNATVNPGGEAGECNFEYGPTTSYGSTVTCTPSPGFGTSAVAVSASVTGLSANTTYHFRISASNPAGSSEGSDKTLKTLANPSTVETRAASSVTLTAATLNATVNPNGAEVSECKLEYGTTTSYGSSASCKPPPGSGSGPVAVAASVTGLSANTTYHFRVSATSAGGTSKGSDQVFTTTLPAHYFSGGVGVLARIAQGEKLPVISWGTLSLTNLTTAAKVECRTVIGGYVENPAPGGTEGPPGVGVTQSFNSYGCESAACTPAATKSGPATYVSVEAETVGVPFPASGNETNLNWPSHLLTEGALIRSESENVKLNVICHLNTGTNGKGEPEFGTVVEERAEGSDKPRFVGRCCKASAPPENEFDGGSGTLHHPAPTEEEKVKTEGAAKILGYNEEEVVNAKLG